MRFVAISGAVLAICFNSGVTLAQRFQVTGEVRSVAQHPRINQVCSGCRPQAPVMINVNLSRPDPYGIHPLGEAGNTVTLTIGGQSWSVVEGSASIRPSRNGDQIRLHANGSARSGGAGSPRMTFELNTRVPHGGEFDVVELTFDTCPEATGYLQPSCRAGRASLQITSARRDASSPPRSSTVPLLVVFVGGWGDNSFGGVVRDLGARFRGQNGWLRSRYFEWSQQPAIQNEILAFQRNNPGGAVALVGHSMGGHTAYESARALQGRADIHLLVTLDPVTRSGYREPSPEFPREGGRPGVLIPSIGRPSNVGRWINIIPNNNAVSEESCLVKLSLPSRWRERREADSNLSVGPNHCEAQQMFYQAPCIEESLRALGNGQRVTGACRVGSTPRRE